MLSTVRGTGPPYTFSALEPMKYGELLRTLTKASNVLSTLDTSVPVDSSRFPLKPKICPNSCVKMLSASVLSIGTLSIFAGFGSNHSSFVKYEVPMCIAASYGPEGLCSPLKTASTAPCRNTDIGPTLSRVVVNRLPAFEVGELSNITSTFKVDAFPLTNSFSHLSAARTRSFEIEL